MLVWLRFTLAIWLCWLVMISAVALAGTRRGDAAYIHSYRLPVGIGQRMYVTVRGNGRIKAWYHVPAQAHISQVADVTLPMWPLISLTGSAILAELALIYGSRSGLIAPRR